MKEAEGRSARRVLDQMLLTPIANLPGPQRLREYESYLPFSLPHSQSLPSAPIPEAAG